MWSRHFFTGSTAFTELSASDTSAKRCSVRFIKGRNDLSQPTQLARVVIALTGVALPFLAPH